MKKDGRISDESMQKAKEDHKKREKQLRDNHKAAKSMLLEERIFNDSTSSNFVLSCREMFEANLLPLEDVPLLRKVIEFTSITQHSINFMLRVYVSFKQYDEAIKFLNSCIGYLTEDPDLIELARKSKSAIRHCQKQQQAVDSDDSPPITFGGIEIEI